MATGTPFVRQTSWPLALVTLLVLVGVMALGYELGGKDGMVIALFCYLAYSLASRSLIPREHRRGIRFVRRKQFAEAIPHFDRSFDLFERNRWLDDWRGLVMLSPSRASYREMALLNSAFCSTQIGEGGRAAEKYQRCLEFFPDSSKAQAALRMLAAGGTSGLSTRA